MRATFIAFVLALAAFCACSPLHYAKNGKCATTTTLVADFVIAGALLGVSVQRYGEAREEGQALALATAAMGVALAANLSETACK